MNDDSRTRGDEEQPLKAGASNYGQVVRVGDTVRRPLRDYSPALHALLRHLKSVGFTALKRAASSRFLSLSLRAREIEETLSAIPEV